MKFKTRRRSGTIIICVLSCLLIVTALAASMVKSALQARQTVRQERQLAQTEFLLEAGIQRAVARMQSDAEYRGETWHLPTEVLAGFDSGRVEIEIAQPEDESALNATVIAYLPADSPLSVRRSYTFSASNEE